MKIWRIAVAVWLILMGLIVIVPTIAFSGLTVVMALIAILGGACLLFDR